MLAQESLSLYRRAREIRIASWGASCQRSSQKSMPRNRPCGEADGPLPHMSGYKNPEFGSQRGLHNKCRECTISKI